jgi:hypothetical protein
LQEQFEKIQKKSRLVLWISVGFCPNTKREKDLNCDGKGDIYVKKKDFAVNK